MASLEQLLAHIERIAIISCHAHLAIVCAIHETGMVQSSCSIAHLHCILLFEELLIQVSCSIVDTLIGMLCHLFQCIKAI